MNANRETGIAAKVRRERKGSLKWVNRDIRDALERLRCAVANRGIGIIEQTCECWDCWRGVCPNAGDAPYDPQAIWIFSVCGFVCENGCCWFADSSEDPHGALKSGGVLGSP